MVAQQIETLLALERANQGVVSVSSIAEVVAGGRYLLWVALKASMILPPSQFLAPVGIGNTINKLSLLVAPRIARTHARKLL